MAETSIFWSTGATGDGTSPYTQSQLFAWLRRTLVSDNYASQGVLIGYHNELNAIVGTNLVTIDIGAACVYGIPYESDTTVGVTIATPTTSTRIDRIVLRANWTAQTVRITLISGTEGGPEPALTQTANTTWDIPLWKVTITTGGVITVSDERAYAGFATQNRTENIANGAVTTAQLAGGAATGGALGSDVATLTGTQQLSNKTLASPAVTGTASGNSTIPGAMLQNGAVGTTQLANGAATGAALGSDVATLTGGQTLSNKTLSAPAFSGASTGIPSARAYYNTSFSATTGAWTALSWNATRWATSTVVVSGSKFTPSVAGVYSVGGAVSFGAVYTGVIRGVGVRLNGTTIMGATTVPPHSATYSNAITVSADIYLNGSSDYVEIVYFTDAAMTMPGSTGSFDGHGADGWCTRVANNS